MRIKRPLEEINKADINSSAFTIHEALSVEIYFEHVNNKDHHHVENFFDKSDTKTGSNSSANNYDGFEPSNLNSAGIFSLSDAGQTHSGGKLSLDTAVGELNMLEFGLKTKCATTEEVDKNVNFFYIPTCARIIRASNHEVSN